MRTGRQYDLLDFIEEYTRENGYAPSYREMMNSLGYLSTATVKEDLEALRDEGRVSWVPGKARTIQILESK